VAAVGLSMLQEGHVVGGFLTCAGAVVLSAGRVTWLIATRWRGAPFNAQIASRVAKRVYRQKANMPNPVLTPKEFADLQKFQKLPYDY